MNEGALREIWVYLSTSPLLGLTVTLVAYQAGFWLYRRAKLNPLVNPVLIAIVALVALLSVTGTSYATYFEGAQFVHFLLGPATVALAVPLYRNFQAVRRSAVPLARPDGSWAAERADRRAGGPLAPSPETGPAPSRSRHPVLPSQRAPGCIRLARTSPPM